MFWRSLCAFCLLASSAAAEFVVRQGDYYETLQNTGEAVRITGGRIDNLVGFGGSIPVTIEGGSIGTIRSGGNLELHFRGGGFQIDNPVLFDDGPMGDSDIMLLYFENVYSMNAGPLASPQGSTERHFEAWFSDFTYGQVTAASDPVFLQPAVELTTYLDNPPGDTQGDGVVDLADMNNVRNFFGEPAVNAAWLSDANGDGLVDLGDLNDARNNFGADYTIGGNPVPEPPMTALLLLQTTALLLARWWRWPSSLARRQTQALSS